jgi:hypothetical protein
VLRLLWDIGNLEEFLNMIKENYVKKALFYEWGKGMIGCL